MKIDRKIKPEISTLSNINIPKPERITMRNGMKLNVIQAGSEEVIRFDLLVNGGQSIQTQPLEAMFTNRMLREGTATLSSSEISERLDFYGAWLDLSSSVNYGFVTLYSLNKYAEETLAIVASMVKEPIFPERELSIVCDANKQQFLVNSTRVEMMARKGFNVALFGENHPFSTYAVEEDYDKVTQEVVRAFYEKCYHSGNCSIYVSGKVTPAIINSIETHFGNESWGKKNGEIEFNAVAPFSATQKRVFVEKVDALQSSIKLGGFVMDRKHPDFLKTRVLTTLLGGYFGSRLMSNIREDKGYTYGIGAGLVSYPTHTILMVATEAANEYVEPIIAEVHKEMDLLRNELVTEEELQMVKSYMLGDMCRSYEGPFSLSEAWIYTETAYLEDDFYQRSLNAIKEVTRQEIQELACKYFNKENLIEVVAGKKM
ncbi:MAG: M16 family metallopeptidase [Phocaeicola sp.]